jgi:glycosyltransferase involved in cell wall biosynthesis
VARRHRGDTLAPTHPSTDLTMSGDGSPALLDLTVVVPYYNPGAALRETVERAVSVLEETGISFEVVTVSDGSTDGSEATLHGLDPDVVVQVTLPHAGKGNAVRAGLARGRGRYLGFIDGDGDVPPELLADFVALVDTRHPDVILGSKRHPDSDVVYPVARRLYSWGYQQLVRVLFHLDVRDTQAGIKLVRREVLVEVLPRMVEQGYAFDLEMLVIARQLGYRDLLEAPVRIGRRFTSTVSRRVVIEMLRDTFSIWRRLRAGDAAGGAKAHGLKVDGGTGTGTTPS